MDWKIYPINGFDDHKREWDGLNASNGGSPLLESRFVMPLLENFGTEQEKLAVCTHGGAVCCMAIVSRSRMGVWQTFQPSQAPVGFWIQDLSIELEKLGEHLRKSLPGTSLILGITQQDPSLLPRPKDSSRMSTMDYIDTARVPIEGSFENYWSKRGKNLRQNLRRQRNRLGRESVDVTLDIVSAAESMHEAVKDYGVLESAGWKSGLNTAIHIDNSQGKFYKQMLQKFAETAQAFVFQYRYNGELVATDLCIIGGGSLIILKTTYDESITTSSPAMLMREDAFKHIFSEQLAERIEFYGKVMEWHTKWSDEIRTMYHINFYSPLGALISRLRR